MAFVMKYVTTAQHLETDPIFWTDQVEPMLEAGDQVTFPNLHTLVTSPSEYSMPPAFIAIQSTIGHASNHTLSVLRRLAIVEAGTPDADEYISIPFHFSSLTHLSISTSYLSLSFWIPLTSAMPCLQWAYIAFEYLADADVEQFMNPTKRTLPQLSELVIESGDGDNCLMGPLFKDLHLPALKNLFLSSVVDKWWDHRGIPDICTILQSAPALSNLTLRKYFYLSPVELNYSTGTLPGAGDVAPQPIWHCAPHLVNLQLELHIRRAHNEIELGKVWDIFAHSAFFSSNRWLDLDNAACPIKTITVIDHWLRTNRQLETRSIRTCAGNATNITFQVPSESYSYFADLWMTWRSGN
ncbi:hypothetical protein BJ912DRAFT_967573 [Pholiota molesta]|nr:hypothetical protein BJ912DRAFT_967573 [Pholiota molesta]